MHNVARALSSPSRGNLQEDLVHYLWYCCRKQIECGLAWCGLLYASSQWSKFVVDLRLMSPQYFDKKRSSIKHERRFIKKLHCSLNLRSFTLGSSNVLPTFGVKWFFQKPFVISLAHVWRHVRDSWVFNQLLKWALFIISRIPLVY